MFGYLHGQTVVWFQTWLPVRVAALWYFLLNGKAPSWAGQKTSALLTPFFWVLYV